VGIVLACGVSPVSSARSFMRTTHDLVHFRRVSGVAALAVLGLGLGATVACFWLAAAPERGAGNVSGAMLLKVAASPVVSAPRVSPWVQLADMRRQLNGASLSPAALKDMVASLQEVMDQRPDAAVTESASRMMVECWTRLGDKQAALDAFLAHLDQSSSDGREAVAWELVRSARKESRHGGTFLASQKLDEFFAHFSTTAADDAALLLAAQVHLEQSDIESAIGFYRTHIARHPGSPMREFASLCLASLYRTKGDREQAQAIMTNWETERSRRENAPAPASKEQRVAPAHLKPCVACGE
jgi:hypothetical protein